MKRGLVVPAAVGQPCTTIEWERGGELLPLLYDAIGCSFVETVPVYLDGAELTIWVDESGWYAPTPILNAGIHRFLTVLGGGAVSPIVGTVVITEGADPHGETLGLRDELLQQLQHAMGRTTAGDAR